MKQEVERRASVDFVKEEEVTQPNSAMRVVALFLDGMTRALIFSFGPSLVYRLVYGGSLKLGADCAAVAFPFALVSAAFLFGRALGSHGFLGRIVPDPKVPGRIARLSGVVVALLVFTFGAGLKSVWWLVMIRFASGALLGRLCILSLPAKAKRSMTVPNQGPDDDDTMPLPERVEIEAGTIKIYLAAFALAILGGGLLYRHITNDATFQALTGSDHYTISPLFLIGVSLVGEWVLRCLFSSFSSNTHHSEDTEIKFQKNSESDRSIVTKPLSKGQPSVQIIGSFEEPGRFRLDSGDSEFFDCRSVLSGMDEEAVLEAMESQPDSYDKSETQLCRYVDRKCVDGNHQPSFVPAGESPNTIPANFLSFCNGNKRKAGTMYKATQQWRRKANVWRIHRMPTPWFQEIRKAYPHYIHGISKQGYIVLYEQPGKMDLKTLFRGGCKVSDMLHYYTFLMEFLANHVSTNAEVRNRMDPSVREHLSSWGNMSILDIGGVSMSQVSTDVLAYLKGAGDIGNSHYPLGLKRAFVVNAPFWASGVWGTFKGVIPDSVPVDILSQKQYLDALREFIDDDQIPKEYGGSSPYSLGEHPFELALVDLIDDIRRNGPEMDMDVEDPVERRQSYSPTKSNAQVQKSFSTWQRASQPSLGTRRRRNEETSASLTLSTHPDDDLYERKSISSHPGEEQIWLLVSVIFVLWAAVQGMLEVAISLWILTPTELGGLGYAPSRSGVTMFASTIVLLFIMRNEVLRVLSKIPKKAPMRSFRIGAGSEAVLLLLLAAVPQYVEPQNRTDSVLVMTTTIIFLSCIVVASILGRVSVTNLHIFSSYNLNTSTARSYKWLPRQYDADRLLSECRSGIFTKRLALVAEMAGVLIFAPLSFFALESGQKFPLDGTFCLVFASLVIVGVYACSYSIHLDANGDFIPKMKRGRTQGWFRDCCSFFREVATVAASDVASLMDETNVSFSPLLGRFASN